MIAALSAKSYHPGMEQPSSINIRPLTEEDFNGWRPLWDANNQGHSDAAVTQKTWERLTSQSSAINGLLARYNGHVAGLLHYVLHPVTGHISPVCYMQDVFVAPDYRRNGIARALIHKLAQIGQQENWARIYWLAENDNQAAQNLYRSIGLKLNFSLHVLPL